MTPTAQLDTNLDELRQIPGPRETPAADSREVVIFGVYDRLTDHDNCTADVVLVPANADGLPDWDHADPTNLESLPADEWPEDQRAAMRAAVLVSNLAGCEDGTSLLVFLRENNEPSIMQISGPETDRDIAHAIIGRDIGAKPVERPPSRFAESLAKLTAELFPPKATAPVAANDNRPQPRAQDQLAFINPAQWHGQPIPVRQWYAEELVPLRQVTILNGDGGVGKSLLALQIAAAGAMSIDTLDMTPLAGRTMYVGAEDEAEEFWRRLDAVARAHGKDLSELWKFRLLPLADRDALLAVPDRRGNMEPTPLLASIIDQACEFLPRLVVFDTAADLFGGDEIKRGQVRQFIGMLRQMAIGLDCAVILLAHPSVQGMQSGTGSSGSTAWNNSVRSRLYLTRPEGKDVDPDLRILKTMKANYGATGGEIKLRWKDGVFVLDDGKPRPGSQMLAVHAERVFKNLLSLFNRTGQNVSDVTGTSYAPAKMAQHPDAEGVSKKSLKDAMQRLLDRGDIKIVMEGPPSRQRKRLILASEDYGPEE